MYKQDNDGVESLLDQRKELLEELINSDIIDEEHGYYDDVKGAIESNDSEQMREIIDELLSSGLIYKDDWDYKLARKLSKESKKMVNGGGVGNYKEKNETMDKMGKFAEGSTEMLKVELANNIRTQRGMNKMMLENDMPKTYVGSAMKLQARAEDLVKELKHRDVNIDSILYKDYNKYRTGGSIDNQYKDKTPKEIWSEWSIEQKSHFLKDHFLTNTDYSEDKKEQLREAKYLNWDDLPRVLQMEVERHIFMGQYAVGGEVGNQVSFKGDYGTPRSGIVKEKRGSSYIVATDNGDRLVDSYEVISFSDAPMEKKKRFGFFEGGGSIKKYYDVFYTIKGGGSMVSKNIEANSEEEAKEKLTKQMRASSSFDKPIAAIQKFENGGGVHTMPDGEVMLNSAHYEGGGEFQNENSKYLHSISKEKKSKILKNIASHYGISMAAAEEEVKDEEAEMLYEYIANDPSLRMEIYKDMKTSKYEGGGEIYKLAESMTDSEYDKNYIKLNEKQKRTFQSLIRLGDEPKLALATVLLNKDDDNGNSDTWKLYTYEGGGEIQSKIDKLNKVVNSKMLPEGVKEKARKQIAELEKELHESKEKKGIPQSHLDLKSKARSKVDVLSFDDWMKENGITFYKRTYYWVADDGGADYMYSGEYNDVKKSLKNDWEQYKLAKLNVKMSELHESKETKTEEKSEHKAGGSEYGYVVWEDGTHRIISKHPTLAGAEKYAKELADKNKGEIYHFGSTEKYERFKAEEGKSEYESKLDEKEELNATIQKLYGIESKAEDLINYQSGGIQSQSVDKIKKYVEYINKEVSKLNVPFGSEVYSVLQDENAHSLNLTLGLLGFYKNEKDNGEWAKKHEQYTKLVDVVNEIKGGGKKELRKITQEEWNTKKKHDYASIKDGQKYILTNENGATILVPVEIVKSEAKKTTTRKAPVKKEEDYTKLTYSYDTVKVSKGNEYPVSIWIDEKGKEYVTGQKHSEKVVNTQNTLLSGFNVLTETEKAKFKTPAKPKADHKKLLAKIKAKKGAAPSNEPSKGHKRSESSDRKREALPLGKRVSADGNTYYENRLNRADMNKEDKFEGGGGIGTKKTAIKTTSLKHYKELLSKGYKAELVTKEDINKKFEGGGEIGKENSGWGLKFLKW